MYEFLEYRVADAMTYHPITVRPTATLAELEALFEQHDHDCLPVCDERGALVGVVTKLDLLAAFAFPGDTMLPRYDEIMQRPAASVMTAEAITVTRETPLTQVIQEMVITRHQSFPVTMGKVVLLGMISRRDVMRALRRASAGERAGSATPEAEPWTTPPSSGR